MTKRPATGSLRTADERLGRSDRRGLRPADARTRRRTLISVMVAVAVVIGIGIPAYGVWRVLVVPDAMTDPGIPVTVEVPAGAGTAEIAGMLAEAGVIDNAVMMRVRARVQGIDGKLRPGVYQLETGMAYGAVEERLLAGPPLEVVTVTVPEGFRVEQIAERFERDAGVPADEFIALALGQASAFEADHPYLADVYNGSLEGYLFPKTYKVTRGASASDAIEMMLDQFDVEIASVDLTYPTSKGLTLHDVVTLASMIEREARLDDERPLVASVIYNRLGKGMRLEIDATIEYVIKKNRPRLLSRDLKIDSPYNTYRNAGLPPGPIASPGLASLQAAASPATTDYLYYVLTGEDGSHTFTVTHEEFLRAKEKSREVTP